MATLKVLTLSTLFPDKSRPTFGPFVERQTLGLAALPDVEVEVVAPRGIPPLLSRHPRYQGLAALPSREEWKGLDVHRPRFAHLPGGRFDAWLMARALTPVLREIRTRFAFDVIDAQFFFPDGPAAVALGRAFDVPVLIKARGADIHHWGASPATRRQIVTAGRAADDLLAVSAALRDDMIALGLPDRIKVHRTGIDRDLFRVRDRTRAKAKLGVAGPLVVSVGALIERKGQRLLIEAMRALPDVQLALLGDGPDRAALEARGGNVRLLGSQPQGVIADWLAAADVMALPSASEGLANAWIEALASGTPIVITDVGGAREVLDRPEAGCIVARDPAAIADAIRMVLAAPPSRDAVAATVEDYSWEGNARELRNHLLALKRA